MDAIDVIVEYGKEHGYDGLYNGDGECACLWDELRPCDGCISDCTLGYIQPNCPDGYAFWMSSEKPGAKKKTAKTTEVGTTLSCPSCGSGEWLENPDENQNSYCGQCGAKLEWPEGDGC